MISMQQPYEVLLYLHSMPRRRFLDAPGGAHITYDVVTEDGYRMAPFMRTPEAVQQNFDSIPSKPCREDDILLCSYPKSGANWLWELLTLCVLRRSAVTGGTKAPGMLEMARGSVQAALPSPRLLNTHVNFRFLPKEARQKRIKCILLCRNPKDVAVSMYNHVRGIAAYEYEGKFRHFLQMFMRGEVDNGSYPAYLLEWQRAIRDNLDWNIHVMYYEDLKQNCFHEMRRLCEYLGLDIGDELLREIVANCQIDRLRRGKDQRKPDIVKRWEQKHLKNNFSFYRKGGVGGWKSWFSVEQSEEFDRWWASNTSHYMFRFRYTDTNSTASKL